MSTGGGRRFGVRGAVLAALWVGLLPALAWSACPDPTERTALRAQADNAMQAGASLDTAWGQIVAHVRQCGEPEAEIQALADWADAARRIGDTKRQGELVQTRVEFAARHGLIAREAEARVELAMISSVRGEVEPAFVQLDAALDRYRRLGDVAGQARVQTELSRLERRRGNYLVALRYELAGLELRRRLDPPPELWRSLLNLAVLYEQIELFDEAHRYYTEALTEAERAGDPEQIADALNGYAGFLNDFGADSAPRALEMAQRALRLHLELGDTARIGSCLLQVARAQLNLGQFQEAETAFNDAYHLAEIGDFAALRAHVDFRWGELELARGKTQEALARIDRARAEYERQFNRHRLIKVYGVLERIHTSLGDELAAAKAGREHFRLRTELLGADATGKLGELLTNFALADERLRSENLRQENAVTAVKLESERRLRLAGFAIVATVVLGLFLLAWRHAAVRRLYRLLREKSFEIEAQRAALAEANAQLTVLNRVDTLTGLATRSYGLEHLAELLARARARGCAPALLLFDLDHFKEINDHFGHLAGDHVLATVAATIRELVPTDALGARVGGEEFMLVLEDAEHERAQMLADAIRRRVRDLAIDVGPRWIQVTLSVGVAHAVPGGGTTVREIYAAADQALYEAKHAGRDCVRTFSG